jgi:hypothetical protein
VIGAVAVLGLGVFPPTAVIVLLALRKLLPAGALLSRWGLPSVIGTRGLMSASFFAAEAYIVFVLEEEWGLSAGLADWRSPAWASPGRPPARSSPASATASRTPP